MLLLVPFSDDSLRDSTAAGRLGRRIKNGSADFDIFLLPEMKRIDCCWLLTSCHRGGDGGGVSLYRGGRRGMSIIAKIFYHRIIKCLF